MNAEEIKEASNKLVTITCYDYSTAKILDKTNVDIILVGDSLGTVMLGLESTSKVTMQDMIRHTQAVKKGTKKFIVADMPYNSDKTKAEAEVNAQELILAGADAVKIEGKPEIANHLTNQGFFVMGHVGLLPQTAKENKVQGKDESDAAEIVQMAKDLQGAGCFAVVLEAIPRDLAKKITQNTQIPTIGIGAGPDCNGQVLVINDLLGLFNDFKPKFVKRYDNLNEKVEKAVNQYSKEVKEGNFPTDEFSFN